MTYHGWTICYHPAGEWVAERFGVILCADSQGALFDKINARMGSCIGCG